MVAWTEELVLKQLWRHFTAQSWACIPQVTVALDDGTPDRRIDLLGVRKPRRPDLGALETLAVEVKVTRQDYFADVRHPEKQAAWRAAATRHAFAVPAGLVTVEDVPEGSGLLAVKADGGVEWAFRAPYRDGHTPQMPPRVWHALAWRTSGLEAHTRAWNYNPDATDDTQELRAAVQAARRETDKVRRDLERAQGAMSAWREAYVALAPNGHPCHWCGRPVKPLHPGRDGFRKWRHLDPDDDAPCALMETAELERDARAVYDAADAREREWRVRDRHRRGFDEAVEREPWRAFIYLDPQTGKPHLSGPRPGVVLPDRTNRERLTPQGR